MEDKDEVVKIERVENFELYRNVLNAKKQHKLTKKKWVFHGTSVQSIHRKNILIFSVGGGGDPVIVTFSRFYPTDSNTV